jgi:bacillithiol biosynthesis cysteine-adding enzyme BshC
VSFSSDTATAGAGIVRQAIDVRCFPWIRPLVPAYVHDFSSVSSLFAGNPADPSSWRDAIARIQRSGSDRRTLVDILTQQLERRAAPPEAREAAARLANPAAVAVVTGQQAGLFGGPLYTLLKATTALQLARRIREEFDTPATAIFWVDEEDHDWNEVRTADVLSPDLSLRHVSLADVAGAGDQPVATLRLDEGIGDALGELERWLAPTEHTSDVLALLRSHYQAGATMSGAFAGWLEALLGRHGLVIFQSADPSAKTMVADLFAKELAQGRTARLAREAGRRMAAQGHQPQVDLADDSVALFYLDERGRHAVRRRGDALAVDDREYSATALVESARTTPEKFSPNVLLRPLVQDRLFPTVCYVSGPSELAYQAQLGAVYREFGIEPPLLYPRASATVLDSAAVRFLERYRMPLDALQAQDDSMLNRLLESQLPPAIEQALEGVEAEIVARAASLKGEIKALDPTLTGAIDTTVERMQDTLKTLHHKIIQASKRKNDTLRRQFLRTRALAFPGGHAQERVLNLVFFLNRHGLSFCDRLLETLPLDMGLHYVLTP